MPTMQSLTVLGRIQFIPGRENIKLHKLTAPSNGSKLMNRSLQIFAKLMLTNQHLTFSYQLIHFSSTTTSYMKKPTSASDSESIHPKYGKCQAP